MELLPPNTTYTRDAIYMYDNLIGGRTWAAYGAFWLDVARGGINSLAGDPLLM